MKRLLQIDSCLCVGSTGHISESIAQLAQQDGWECYIIHGARYVKRPSCMKDIQTGTIMDEYIHYAESLLLDNHGLASRQNTKRIIEEIKKIKPDLIQLHCIHGYYINYRILFEYLNSTQIPIVWTFHDCWAFTGHCAHFITAKCERWQTQCHDCPLTKDYPTALIDRSTRNYYLKKQLFNANNNLHIVPVSDWLGGLVQKSFLKRKPIRIIKNGIDLNVFKPLNINKDNSYTVLGVASTWDDTKGLKDFYKLREFLPQKKYKIILVGLTNKQIGKLPENIIGITKTDSVQTLAKLYSQANVFVNPTYADTYPTTNLEAIACGTPVVTYDTGGSPESINKDTGIVVKQGDINGLAEAIQDVCKKEKSIYKERCRTWAEQHFDMHQCFKEYIKLYKEIVSR